MKLQFVYLNVNIKCKIMYIDSIPSADQEILLFEHTNVDIVFTIVFYEEK